MYAGRETLKLDPLLMRQAWTSIPIRRPHAPPTVREGMKMPGMQSHHISDHCLASMRKVVKWHVAPVSVAGFAAGPTPSMAMQSCHATRLTRGLYLMKVE